MTNEEFAKLFSAVATRTLIVGHWYRDTTIKLDGYHFSHCRFDNCLLRYDTLDFQITGCMVVGGRVQHGFDGLLAIRTFNLGHGDLDGRWPPFAPIRHIDGTLSINADLRPG